LGRGGGRRAKKGWGIQSKKEHRGRNHIQKKKKTEEGKVPLLGSH